MGLKKSFPAVAFVQVYVMISESNPFDTFWVM